MALSTLPQTPTVFRGSTRPVVWRLWQDAAETVPRIVDAGSVAVLQLTRGTTTMTKRSDEDDGLMLYVGGSLPAMVEWKPTSEESETFTGLVRVEIESWFAGRQVALLPRRSFVNFINGSNPDA